MLFIYLKLDVGKIKIVNFPLYYCCSILPFHVNNISSSVDIRSDVSAFMFLQLLMATRIKGTKWKGLIS